MDTLNGSLLVGTLGCDVVELYSAKAALISSAHCRGELWGICVHPKHRTRFVTTGDDATMRIWDSDARQMVNMQQLDSGARALAFSPDGKTMAVGLGIGRPQPHLNNEGAFNIFTFERRGAKITLTNEARPAKSWIREMRFSADGEMCGCASEDSNVYILGGTDFELRETLRGLTGPATHLDFSTDGNVVQVTSAQSAGEAEGTVAGHELAFHNPRDGAAIDEPSKTRVRPRVLCHTLSPPPPPPLPPPLSLTATAASRRTIRASVIASRCMPLLTHPFSRLLPHSLFFSRPAGYELGDVLRPIRLAHPRRVDARRWWRRSEHSRSFTLTRSHRSG